jgi:SH3 domain protein
MVRAGLLLLLLAVSQIAAAQEVGYVTDILRLGIHRAQDTSDRPFQNLVSGTELAILERVPNFARVRTSDGQEGWVKSAYLVSEKPAQLRVAEVETELESLRAELAAAVAAQGQAQAEAGRVTQEMAQSLSSGDAIRDTLGRLQQENEDFEQRLEQYRGAIPWTWVAIALGVALVAGFLAGMWWLDNSIRRRFGGFRPY